MARILKTKRMVNAYNNYVKRYKAKEKSMKRRGLTMNDTMLNKREYVMVRRAMVEEEGITKNINQTLVAEQQYQYSQKAARNLKETAQLFNLDWKNEGITKLRTGAVIDLSAINDYLKENNPNWTGKDRAHYITYEVLGSE